MNEPIDAAPEPAFEIRFGPVGLAQLRVRSTDPEAICTQLAARIAAAPALFERAGVCLDLSAIADPRADEVRIVLETIRRAGMLPVGLTHGNEAVDVIARELGLPILGQVRAQIKPAPAQPAGTTAAPSTPVEAQSLGAPALMHHRPVRSGQRVYARHRDLIVTHAVGAGAEVIADGCVHIYASLRGRAMAGAHGDVTARVFCQEFHAELVSIAGVFRVFETIPAELAGQPVQAWLEGEDLKFAKIK